MFPPARSHSQRSTNLQSPNWVPTTFGALFIVTIITLPVCNGAFCQKKVCEYDFVITQTRTMSYTVGRAVYSVGLNGTSLTVVGNSYRPKGSNDMLGKILEPSDVITADGVVRSVIAINGQFPGPSIEVAEGAEVVIRVTNQLLVEGLTIHWHGLSLNGTPWMDGTPYVTQCPILPRQTFTYRFTATPSGTHWYHSQVMGQRADGLSGFFIVHDVPPATPYFNVAVQDWFHVDSSTLIVTNPYGTPHGGYRGSGEVFYQAAVTRGFSSDGIETDALGFQSALINGRGRWGNETFPLTEFNVESGRLYRFRMVNSGLDFAFKVSIDGHALTVVAMDGHGIKPVVVDSIIINVGERFDFELTANRVPSRYWLRAQSLRDPRDGVLEEVKAILVYDTITESGDPDSKPKECTTSNPCVVLNCPFTIFPKEFHSVCRNIETMQSTNSERVALKYIDDPNIFEVFYNLGYSWGSSVNGRKFIGPSAPPYENNAKLVSCSKVCTDGDKGCVCTFKKPLPYNKTVQMVVSNLDEQPFLSHHTVYLHGHHFAVVKTGYPEFNQSTGRFGETNNDIVCENNICESPRWRGRPPSLQLETPPVKDTVIVPARGYVVLRFRSDNPGLRMLECTASTHRIEGMAMIIDEASEHYTKPPASLSSCPVSMEVNTPTSTDSKNGRDTTEGNQQHAKNWTMPDNVVMLSLPHLIGLIIGCLVLGVILAVLVAVTLNCCIHRNKGVAKNTPL